MTEHRIKKKVLMNNLFALSAKKVMGKDNALIISRYVSISNSHMGSMQRFLGGLFVEPGVFFPHEVGQSLEDKQSLPCGRRWDTAGYSIGSFSLLILGKMFPLLCFIRILPIFYLDGILLLLPIIRIPSLLYSIGTLPLLFSIQNIPIIVFHHNIFIILARALSFLWPDILLAFLMTNTWPTTTTHDEHMTNKNTVIAVRKVFFMGFYVSTISIIKPLIRYS